MKDKYLIGFIGLGIMGKPMAVNLLKKGYELFVYDLGADKVEYLVTQGAHRAPSLDEIGSKCNVIITMLPNSADVARVVNDTSFYSSLKEGTIFIDMSSIDPLVSKELSNKLEKIGVIMLDAPVSGGEPKAISADLAIMVGGNKDDFVEVEGILSCMGSSVKYVGEIGSGNVTKLANQIIVAVNIAAICEAYTLAKKAGVDPEKVYDAINSGLAGSTVMTAKSPMIFEGNFNPGFKIDLHLKDLNNVHEAAKNLEVPLPLGSTVLNMLKTLMVQGSAKDDHSAIAKYYQTISGVDLTNKND